MLDLFRPSSPFILRARGVSFSPLSLFAASEPGAWFDPSDLTTLFQDAAGMTPVTAAGQSVGRVLDKSGRGFHATQANAAAMPTYQVDSNGRGYLSFDGVDDWLVTPKITPGINKAQVFAGVRKLSNAAQAQIVELSATLASNNGTFGLLGPETAGRATYGFLSKGTGVGVAPSLASYAAPTSNVVSGIGDIAADVATLRVNGTQAVTVSTDQGTGNYLAYPLYIGRRGGTSRSFNGRIYGLIVRFGANLTDDQITQTETWMNSKTGAF